MDTFKQQVARAAAPALGIDEAAALALLEYPKDARKGDLALPCFALAKLHGRPPAEVARAAAARIVCAGPLLEAAPLGPYLNFTLDPRALAASVLDAALHREGVFGGSREGAGRTIVIDFSSPNIAKPFGIHHLRSTVIGAAIGRIHRALGYDVQGVNHLGDWGTQFGQLIVAYQDWGDAGRLEHEGIPYLLELYVRFNEAKASDPQLQERAREAFKRLESGDAACRELWRRFRAVSEQNFRRIYERLGITFEHFTGESFYEDKMEEVQRELEQKGLLSQSEDATVVDLSDDGLGVCIVKKKNDSTLYMTRDLAAAIYRHRAFRFHKALYVVGAAQALHFKQLFKVLEKLGRPYAADMVHVPFGLLRFKDQKMSTRKGQVVYLEEVLDKAVELAAEIAARNPGVRAPRAVAAAVGIGAVIFNDLKNKRIKDVVFDWDEVLSFEGDTGPYLQYTHARLASIFRKAERNPARIGPDADCGLLVAEEERELLRALSRFPEALRRAAREYEPSLVAQQLLEIAGAVNRFYMACRILGTEPGLMEARLALARAAQVALADGLGLLGIAAPEEM